MERRHDHHEPQVDQSIQAQELTIPAVNVTYAVAGFAFVALLLFGPRPEAALEMTFALGMPWIIAYAIDTIALFGSAIVFVTRKQIPLAIPALFFAACAAGMLAVLMYVPVGVGAW